MAKVIKLSIIFLCFIILSGCSFNFSGLMNLRALATNQEETERIIKEEESLFLKLKSDIENNRLKQGISERQIILIYGKPVLTKELNESGREEKKYLLYRKPLEYFDTDLIYLRFDKKGFLSSWELIPAGKKE